MTVNSPPDTNRLSILNPFPQLQPGPGLLHELIADSLTSGTALEYHSKQGLVVRLSYSELHQRANDLAATIAGHISHSTHTIIPILLPQCAALYISQIAVLKSGAAFCPINLDVPEDRLEFILNDISASVIITSPEFSQKIERFNNLTCIVLAHEGSIEHARTTSNPAETSLRRCETTDPAYIMYTSGSTGTPKAVCISHKAVTQSLLAHDRFIPQFSRFLQFANPTFDVSVFETFFPLFRAATLVSCERSFMLSDLSMIINALDVDAAEFTPSVVASLVRSRSNVPNLRTLLTIGEMLNPQTVKEFAGDDLEVHSPLFGMYGPTEAAIHCTLQSRFRKTDSVNTIGIPLDTVSCFVLRPAEDGISPSIIEILPFGETGELAVGGHQLADGYLNRPEQTEAAFIDHPKYGPLYRTGDKARITSAGLLECLGRISKGQVKLRGQRIELGEIEHSASKTDEVHATSASIIDGQLILFCVADKDNVRPTIVEATCRRWLPKAMIPNDIVILQDFPYLPSGKIDQRALEAGYRRQPSHGTSTGEMKTQDPRLFELVAASVGGNLKPASSLAASGLDSLKAIRLATQIRSCGYPQLSAVDILLSPTYIHLEELIGRAKTTQESMPSEELQAAAEKLRSDIVAGLSPDFRDDVFQVAPCTELQDAMLVETVKDKHAYINSVTLDLPADLEYDHFVQALSIVADNNSALRTGFLASSQSASTFVQITWHSLLPGQSRQLSSFETSIDVGNVSSFLLRPFRVQYCVNRTRPRALIHLHHAMYDQWSLDILVDDLYRAINKLDLVAGPQFSEIGWRESLESTNHTAMLFWQSYITGAISTSLPNLTGKVIAPETQVCKRQANVSRKAVQSLAAELSVSEPVISQTAFAHLLGLYAGQTDVCMGSVFSGRTAAIEHVQDIFGPMLATLPVRVSVDGTLRFIDIAKAIQDSNRSIMAHSTLSLAKIRRAADIDPSMNLFDSVFVWQSSSRERIEQESVVLIDNEDFVEFNLIFEVEPQVDSYLLKATYRSNVLPEAHVDVLLDQFEFALKAAVLDRQRKLDKLFSGAPHKPLLSICNPKPTLRDCTGGLPSLMAAAFRKYADRPALLFADDISDNQMSRTVMTFSELDNASNKLAHLLLSYDLQPGGLVLVMMEKSAELYIALLAVIKCGCGYLPVTPGTPLARIQRAIVDCEITHALCDSSSANSSRSMSVPNVITVPHDKIQEYPSTDLEVHVELCNVAYAIWTSGTTGTPKGVMVTQENIVSNILDLGDMYPATTTSRLLQSCNQSFDVSVFEIFWTWSKGMCLCSAKNDVLFRDIENAIRLMEITHLSMTPTVAALIDPANVPQVEFLVTAGEAVTAQVFRRWAGKGLWQGYGPSETTNICSVRPEVATNDAINNIGPPFPNTSAFVLPTSGDFIPLPTGALGELCFGGQQVFKGYQNMPDVTASKIIVHPRFGRIYRSGDLGRLAADGSILIAGRLDGQRKIRGQRIELSEITSMILRTPGVLDAVTIISGLNGNETIIAFWVPAEISDDQYTILQLDDKLKSQSESLKQSLTDALPTYMVPTALVPVRALPRTGQGKIDIKRLTSDAEHLSSMYFEEDEQDRGEGSEILSDLERKIRFAISQTVGIGEAHLRRHTSLIRLGLDSVSAIKLATRIRRETGAQLDVSRVLKSPKLGLLASLVLDFLQSNVQTIPSESSSNSFIPAEERSDIEEALEQRQLTSDRILPCTPLQVAMLSGSSASSYSNRTVLKLQIPEQDLRRHWETLFDRHQILRTIFLSTDNKDHPFVQIVLKQAQLPWKIAERTIEEQELLETPLQKQDLPADSYNLPYSFEVHRTRSAEYLLIDMHHALYDANAMAIMLDEVEKLANRRPLGPAPRFDGFLEAMLSMDRAKGDAFFDAMLNGFSPSPFFSRSKASPSFKTHIHSFPAATDDIERFCHAREVSLLVVCQAAWSVVLSTLQGIDDVCFGNVVSGRSVPVDDIDRLVAPCFNTVPVRIDLKASRTVADLVTKLHSINVDTLAHQLTSLRHIQGRLFGGSRMFDSMILLQQETRPLDSKIWEFIGERGEMDFPCIVELMPSNDRMVLSFHYEQHLFGNDHQVRSICEHFSEAFTSFLRYPMRDISIFSFSHSHDIRSILKTQVDDPMPEADGSMALGLDWTSSELKIREAFLAFSNSPSAEVTKNTSIYRLGLDSISAIQAAKLLRGRDINVTAADILENPSVAALAKYYTAKTEIDGQVPRPSTSFDFAAFDQQHRLSIVEKYGLDYTAIEAIRPCTPLQAGMLTSSARSEGSNYLNHFAYEVALEVRSISELEEVWSASVKGCEMLRTGFVEIDDSKFPFAMVTYNEHHQSSSTMDYRHNDFDIRELERINTRHITERPSSPPWRCHFVPMPDKVMIHLTMHHALYDAESLTQILKQFEDNLMYGTKIEHSSIEKAIDTILQEAGSSSVKQEFWTDRTKLANPIKYPNLHPVIPSSTGMGEVSMGLSVTQGRLHEVCSRMDISVQSVFQAAWAKLLSAYTGEDQVTFGVVSSGRSSSPMEDACFPCINTLPVTCNARTDDKSLLQQFTEFNASSQRYSQTPLTMIQDWIGMPGEVLFDTIFAFQKPLGANSLKALRLVHEAPGIDFPVSLEVEHQQEDRLQLRTTFDLAVLPESQAKMMLGQLESIVLEMIDVSSTWKQSSSLISIIPPKDFVIRTDMTHLQDMFDISVARNPDRMALEFISVSDGGQTITKTWTYGELDACGNQVADLLLKKGVEPGSVVALCSEKCPEAAFAFVGIVKAGCIILGVDATAPLARKEFILSDSKASAVLCSSQVATELGSSSSSCVIIDLHKDLSSDLSSSPPSNVPQAKGASVCYILYTSGTTGTPKGCELTHENTVQALLSFERLFRERYNASSVWCQFASYHFDVAILEHFWTWFVGIKLLCAPRDLILEDLAGFIDEHKVTHIDLTPSLGRLLDPEMVPSLHSGVFITGGEAVKPEMLKSWGHTGCLFNFYGPTECTIGVTTFPSVPSNGKASNIGWQFDNVGTCVLRPGTMDAVMRGAVGELCIFGKLVGKGYLNRPDLTEERFPYMERIEDRIYRTGDLVRILHDGSIEFLGRADSQVKLRGQRLEIDEIIAVMRQRELVKDAVCIVARHDEMQKDQLIAFVSASTNRIHASPSVTHDAASSEMVSKAREACEEKLPGYMVPTHLIPVDFIPLSVNNKQDDKVLKQLYQELSIKDLQGLNQSSNDQRELDDAERKIAETLASTLAIELQSIRPASNIFSLGLNSITALRFARRLKTTGLSQATINVVMQNATISSLTQALRSRSGSSHLHQDILNASRSIAAVQQRYLGMAARRLGCGPDDIKRVAPCTSLQQGLLSRSLREEGKPYFNRFLFRADPSVLDRVRVAFQGLFDSTDILRVSFVDSDDGHLQVVPKKGRLALTSSSVETEEEARATLTGAHNKWKMSDASGLLQPLRIDMAMYKTSTMVQICIHHALYDGNSWSLTLDKLAALASGEHLEPAKRDFFDALPHGPLRQVDSCESFWREHLQHSSFERVEPLSDQTASQDIFLTKQLCTVASLEDAAKRLHVTPQSVLQAAWITTLAPHHQGPLGMIVSGRSLDIDVDHVIGPLFNTVPFAWSIAKEDTWSTIVQRCHEFSIASLPFHHTPLRNISKWLRLSPETPLFETLFVYQQAQDQSDKLSRFLEPVDDQDYVADYPMSLEAGQDAAANLTVTIGVQKQICDASFVEQLIDSFEANMAALINDPEAKPTLTDACFSHTNSAPPKIEHKIVNSHDDSFQWTVEAENLRSELANLANVEPPAIDEHSTIFSLGLDSIDAVKLSSRLRKYNISAPVSVLMRNQTIPKILDVFRSTSSRNSPQKDNTKRTLVLQELKDHVMSRLSPREDVESILPATPMQEGLISEMIRSNYKSYFNHDVLRILPGTDVAKLSSAWEAVVSNSPVLRTFFLEVDDTKLDSTYAQVIVKAGSFEIDEMTLNADDDMSSLLDKIRKETARASAVPPFRLTLLAKGSDKYVVLSIAHALYDGFSLGLLHEAVQEAYDDHLRDSPSYKDVVLGAIESTGSDATAFWEAAMTNVQTTILQTRDVASDAETYRIERPSASKSTEVKTACQELGVTVQTACQAAWALTLARLSKCLDVTYGLVLAGRDSPEAQKIMFPTMNTVAFRSNLHGTAQAFLKDTQAAIIDMMAFQQTPLRHIQRVARKDGFAIGPLFNTLFTFQKRTETIGQTLEPLYESVQGASDVEYPIAIEAELMDDKLVWRAAIKNSVMDGGQAERLLIDVDRCLTALLSNVFRQILSFDGELVRIFNAEPFKIDLGTDFDVNDNADESESTPSDTFNDIEAQIRDVVAQVARIDPSEVGKDTRLDNLGIDSISAIKVSSILRRQSVNLTVSHLILAGTIAKAAATVRSKEQPAQGGLPEDHIADMDAVMEQRGLTAQRLGLDPSHIERILPASAGQMYTLGIWAASGGELFRPTFTYRLDGCRDEQKIYTAWRALIDRHAILRTTFMYTRGVEDVSLIQVVQKSQRDSTSDSSVEKNWPSINTLPNLEVVSQSDQLVVRLSIHHALYDAVSLRALMDELAAEVGGKYKTDRIMGMESFIMESLSTQYRSQQEAFWTDYLGPAKSNGSEVMRHEDPQSMAYSGPRIDVFDPEVLPIGTDFESRLRREGISLHALFFAAYGQHYATAHKKEGDVIIGIYLANRSHGEGAANSSIPTVNMVPLKIGVTGTPSLGDVARRVQEDLRQISQPPRASVDLNDIFNWTGVKIDTFINFVKLPTEDEDASADKQSIRITNLDEERELRKRAEVHDAKPKGFDLSHDIRESGVDLSMFPVSHLEEYSEPRQKLTWTQPSIDVEATVRNGQLGMGVFGYESKVTLKEADALIRGVRDRIEEFLA